MDNFFEQFT